MSLTFSCIADSQAYSIETDSATRSRYNVSLTNINSHIRSLQTPSNHNLMLGLPGQLWYDRLENAKRAGYTVEPSSAVELALYSLQQCREGLEGIEKHLIVNADGTMHGDLMRSRSPVNADPPSQA